MSGTAAYTSGKEITVTLAIIYDLTNCNNKRSSPISSNICITRNASVQKGYQGPGDSIWAQHLFKYSHFFIPKADNTQQNQHIRQ